MVRRCHFILLQFRALITNCMHALPFICIVKSNYLSWALIKVTAYLPNLKHLSSLHQCSAQIISPSCILLTECCHIPCHPHIQNENCYPNVDELCSMSNQPNSTPSQRLHSTPQAYDPFALSDIVTAGDWLCHMSHQSRLRDTF